MYLSPSQGIRVMEAVKKKLSNHDHCPLCGSEKWTLAPALWELTGYKAMKDTTGRNPPVAPVVLITCPDCGNMTLLSAIALGLIDRETGGWTDE